MAGKNVYNEKPLALDREMGRKLVRLAKSRKLRLGGAPDTFFGARPANLPETHRRRRPSVNPWPHWHLCSAAARKNGTPAPTFSTSPAAAPCSTWAPYYLTRPAQLDRPHLPRQCRNHRRHPRTNRRQRTRCKGQKIQVHTPDHFSGNIEFASGAVGTLVTSFAVAHANFPNITIFGTEGTLAVPDPNMFDNPVRICRGVEPKTPWEDVTFTHATGYGPMVGVAGHGLRHPETPAAPGVLSPGFHRARCMQGFLESAQTGRAYKLKAKYVRPAPLPAGAAIGVLD